MIQKLQSLTLRKDSDQKMLSDLLQQKVTLYQEKVISLEEKLEEFRKKEFDRLKKTKKKPKAPPLARSQKKPLRSSMYFK